MNKREFVYVVEAIQIQGAYFRSREWCFTDRAQALQLLNRFRLAYKKMYDFHSITYSDWRQDGDFFSFVDCGGTLIRCCLKSMEILYSQKDINV